MINLVERDRLLNYIHDSDTEYVMKKAALAARKNQKQTILSMIIVRSRHKSFSMKEAEAYASQAYTDYLSRLECDYVEYEMIHAQRKTAQLKLDMWQSELSALKTGLVL